MQLQKNVCIEVVTAEMLKLWERRKQSESGISIETSINQIGAQAWNILLPSRQEASEIRDHEDVSPISEASTSGTYYGRSVRTAESDLENICENETFLQGVRRSSSRRKLVSFSK